MVTRQALCNRSSHMATYGLDRWSHSTELGLLLARILYKKQLLRRLFVTALVLKVKMRGKQRLFWKKLFGYPFWLSTACKITSRRLLFFPDGKQIQRLKPFSFRNEHAIPKHEYALVLFSDINEAGGCIIDIGLFERNYLVNNCTVWVFVLRNKFTFADGVPRKSCLLLKEYS